MPTIHHRAGCKMVGTLRFAHPTRSAGWVERSETHRPCRPPDDGFRCALPILRITDPLPQHRDEEPIRACPARRHQPPSADFSAAFSKSSALSQSTLAVSSGGRSRTLHGAPEAADLPAVFARQHRAGDIGDAPAGLTRVAARSSTSAWSFNALPARRGASAIWRRGCGARCRCRCRARRSARDRLTP